MEPGALHWTAEERPLLHSLVEILLRLPPTLVAAHALGAVCATLRLPRITGYLLAGVAAGPHALALLDNATTSSLWPLESLCLAVIGVAAGCELSVDVLRRREFRSSVLTLTAAITLSTLCFLFPAVVVLGPRIGFLAGEPLSRVLGVASLVATLGVARSPASMIAVLRETQAAGPFSQLVTAVTGALPLPARAAARPHRPRPQS